MARRTSPIVRHTITVPIDGFESLEVTYNVGLTGAQVDLAQRQGVPAFGLLDFPNWEEVAPALGLCQPELDEEGTPVLDEEGTPVLSDRALPKPLPFTQHVENLPLVLSTWLALAGLTYATATYVRDSLNPTKRR